MTLFKDLLYQQGDSCNIHKVTSESGKKGINTDNAVLSRCEILTAVFVEVEKSI